MQTCVTLVYNRFYIIWFMLRGGVIISIHVHVPTILYCMCIKRTTLYTVLLFNCYIKKKVRYNGCMRVLCVRVCSVFMLRGLFCVSRKIYYMYRKLQKLYTEFPHNQNSFDNADTHTLWVSVINLAVTLMNFEP